MTSQAYDTGLTQPQRTLLRSATIDKLAPLKKANGLYVAVIAALPCKFKGEHDAEGLGDIQRTLQGGAPALLVAVGDATFEPAGMEKTEKRGDLELYVYAVSVNPRDVVTGRLENDVVALADITKDPGIETMLEHVKQLLQGQDLGVDSIYEPDITHERESATLADITIWELTFKVQIDQVIKPFRAAPIVTSFETTHSQPDANDPIPNPANPIIDHISPLGVP